jgi:hypothetical protein
MKLINAIELDSNPGEAEGSAVQRTFRGDVFLFPWSLSDYYAKGQVAIKLEGWKAK